MNKYELKYLVETLIASNNNLTDVSGKQTTHICLLYTSPSPRDGLLSRMPSSA